MTIKSLVQSFFSMTNVGKYKVITILGLKIKYNRTQYWLEHVYCNFINHFCKIKPNKFVFINILSWQYADNPKYIANELLKRNIKNYDLVWLVKGSKKVENIPKEFRQVNFLSFKALYEISTAKVLIINAHPFLLQQKGWKKRPETLYFQTWHGSMGIKKCDADAKDVYANIGWAKWQEMDCSNWDYIFVDSNFEKQIYKSQFWGYGEKIHLGKARDSIFFKSPFSYRNKVMESYSIPKTNKILLYAPTWRTSMNYSSFFNIDMKLLKKCLKKRFGGEWTILVRGHNIMNKKIYNTIFDSELTINATNYSDMQELLVAADVLISDYSSCLPEFTILKKPSFIYAADMDKYENGFYYPLSTLPSPIAQDNYELANCILNFNEKLFKYRAEEFLEKMGHKDDENSPVRIVDFILEKMNEKTAK